MGPVKRWLVILPMLLVLCVATPVVAAPTRSRALHASVRDDVGVITIIVSDGTPPTTPQVSVEEEIGGVETLVGGTFAPHELTLTRHGGRFADSGYRLVCDVTPSSTLDTTTDRSTLDIQSFDHVTPRTHVTHYTRMVTLGLECTLTTPQGRTLTGSGGYEKTETRDTGQ